MKYIEVKIFAGKEGIDPLITAVMMLGISDLVIEDQAEIEPNITVYLQDCDEGKDTLGRIKSEFAQLCVECRVVDDETWNSGQREFFKPSKVTERIVVKPSWEEYKAKENELIIELGPGMAFGTGMHPTTTMCMKFMEQYSGQYKSALDIGCGSGILSITAAALGAKDVLGIDIDGSAVDIACDNVLLNRYGGKIRIIKGDLIKGVDFKADLVVANLMAELVMLLAEDLPKNLVPGGIFISSGILLEKREEVRASVKKSGFEIIDMTEEGEWCAISARLRKNGI